MADAETPETVEATVLRATPKQLKVRLERAGADELTIRTDVPDDVRGELEGRRLAVVVTTSRGRLRAELADGFEAAGTVPPTGPEEAATREETGEAAAPAAPKRGRRRRAAAADEAGDDAGAIAPDAAGAAASPAAVAADAPGAPAVTDESAVGAPSPAATAAPEPDEKPAGRRRSRGRRGKGGGDAPAATAAAGVDDTTVPDGLREAVEALRAARVKTPA